MNSKLEKQFDQILDKVTSDQFLSGAGLGNEVSFYIFDYPPEEELHVRKQIAWLEEQIPKRRRELKCHHINIFRFLIGLLRKRNLLDRAFAMQRDKGSQALLRALKGPLQGEKVAKDFAETADPANTELLLVSGVGSVYPLIQVHTLLSNLQSLMGNTVVVFFYPGRYDGVSLLPFGDKVLASTRGEPYYRAFRLITEDSTHAD